MRIEEKLVVWFMSARMVVAIVLVPKRLRAAVCKALEDETKRLNSRAQ